jgi:vacuolar-type H+-ATPase subunit I/STV1
MGENDRRQVFDSITLILRDADHCDRFISIGEKAHELIAAKQQRQEKEEAAKVPPTEEEKEKVRELLKSVRLRRVA